ncbi:MAG: carboxypeptidase-like regulatory domain-containing protein [Blastocatellia bacterium]
MRRAICLALFLVFSLAALSRAQSPSRTPVTREGVITGRVVGEDGQPIARAKVEAYSIGVKTSRPQPVVTDVEGNFKLTGLAPAPYVLGTSIPGYVVERRSRERDLYRLGEHVPLNLIRGGVITGRVTDVSGEPMVGMRVFPRRVRDLEGAPTSFDTAGYRFARVTDDRGIYRFFGLEPGVYVVFIDSNSYQPRSKTDRETPVFHPSSTRDGAAEITVQAGGEVAGVDIRHRVDRGHTISGKVTGEAMANVLLIHLADRQVENTTGVGPSESFEIFGVPDGDYELIAMRGGREGPAVASLPRNVSVRGADVSGIELVMTKLGSISGRLTLEPATPSARCAGATQVSLEESLVRAAPMPGRLPISAMQLFRTKINLEGVAVEPNGEFKMDALFAGSYQLRADLPGDNWFIRAVTRTEGGVTKSAENGIAINAGENLSGIQLRIAEGAASLGGRVVPASESDKLPKQLRAHLIPAEAAAAGDVLRYAETVVAGDGAFEFKHFAPGRYWLLTKLAVEASKDRPIAWDATARVTLRREAENAKNEIELRPCDRVNDYALRLAR